MPFSIKITNSKNKPDEIHEEVCDCDCDYCENGRVERKGVEELIESVQLMSQQLEILLTEVTGRDEKIDKLEERLGEQIMIIESLTKDIESYEEVINDKNNVIKIQDDVVGELREKVEQRDAKIKRLEEENQERYNENDRLKEEIKGLREVNENLERKIEVITGVLKD